MPALGIGIGVPFGQGGAGFSPLAAFSGGKKGLWWDQSDIASSYQDSAATTPLSATGQPVGKGNDKSGNANHFLQATAPARPIYTVAGAISSWVHDGVDDGGSTATFVAGTLSAAMDCFVTVKRSAATAAVIMSDTPGGSKALGVMSSGGAGLAVGAAGAAWTCFVDGVQVGGTANTTEAQLFAALTLSTNKVLEFRDLNMALWTQFTLGLYAAFMLNGSVAQLVLCESQPALRANLRTYCGAKGGLTL